MLALISGISYALIFPKFNLYFLFPVVFVPIIIFAQRSDNTKKIFVFSWLAGIISNLILLYWLYPTLLMNGVGHFPAALGIFLLSLYLGLYWGIFGISVSALVKLNLRFKYLLIPGIWVLLEYAKSYLFTGFPWLLSGYSLWKIPQFLQIASFTGIYGLSYLVVFINTLIAISINTKKVKPVISAIIVTAMVFIYGTITIKRCNTEENFKISIMQGNISQYKKFNDAFKQEILDAYSKLHRDALMYTPEFIVWPETSLPDALTSDMEVNLYMQALVKDAGVSELVGSVEKTRGKYYNSAYMITSEGHISEPYRKIHLTPFGEYFPLRRLLSLFTGVVDELGDFDAGHKYVLLEVRDYRIATGICFESIFPDIIRKFFKKGANIFVNITNDGWFLNTAGAYQHFIHSVIRAVENRTYVIRSANTGISAIIHPTGKVIKKTELLETSVLNGTVGKSDKKTFYTKYGDVFVGICFLFIIFNLLYRNFKI